MEYIIVNSMNYDMLVANKHVENMTLVDSIAYVGRCGYSNITVFVESMLDDNFVMGSILINDKVVARETATLQEQTNDKNALMRMLCDKMIHEFKCSRLHNINYLNAVYLLNDIMR
jgi:hypothetical protein